MTTRTWPVTADELRVALGYETDQGKLEELALYAAAACELIDKRTGRVEDPHRHEDMAGKLPLVFHLGALETAKLWWQQAHAGPRPTFDPDGRLIGPPMGADLPMKVAAWLRHYPPRPGFGQ